MAVTTNYLVTGNGITGSTANAVQALVSGAGITTWALRADVLTAGLTTAFFTDIGVGGSYWDYTGGRWRPQARRVMLDNLLTPASTQATSLGVVRAVALPAGLWQDGDFLVTDDFWTKEGGTAETATIDVRIGTSPTATGLTQGLSTSDLATTSQEFRAVHRFRRLSATTSQNGSVPANGGIGKTTYPPGTRTIPDADAAVSYVQRLGNLNTGAETLWLRSSSLYLESGA